MLCPRCHQRLAGVHRCKALVTAAPAPAPLLARTQKAIGVEAIAKQGWNVPAFVRLSGSRAEAPAAWASADSRLPAFARPCPLDPWHGFVDSRRVETPADLDTVYAETLAADPLGEVLVMPMLDAVASAVVTPGLVVLGPGHDGATSGHGSISIPVVDVQFSSALLSSAKITKAPYLEVVLTTERTPIPHPRAVQLRNGPSLERAQDFIPTPMRVDAVIEAEGDLITWRARVRDLAPGTAVYHPGGSLASHYAVHTKEVWDQEHRAVPLLTTRAPRVGETLTPTAPIPAFIPSLVVRGLGLGMALDVPHADACHLTLFALHNAMALGFQPVGSVLLGAGIACAIRLGLCAALGEARHARPLPGTRRTRGRRRRPLTRDSIYVDAWTHVTQAKRQLPALVDLFADATRWSGSYGGRPWANCAKATLDLVNCVIHFARDPNQSKLSEMVAQYNLVLNQVHNGGWWFNKFTSADDMNHAAQGRATFLFTCLPVLWTTVTAPMPDACPFTRWHLLKSLDVPPPAPKPGAIATPLPFAVSIPPGAHLTHAQATLYDSGHIHVQWQHSAHDEKGYDSANLTLDSTIHKLVASWITAHSTLFSLAGSGKPYAPLVVDGPNVSVPLDSGAIVLLTQMVAWATAAGATIAFDAGAVKAAHAILKAQGAPFGKPVTSALDDDQSHDDTAPDPDEED